MGIKKAVSLGMILVIFSLGLAGTSCQTRQAGTSSRGVSKTKQMKKNRNQYGKRYSLKAKPARKDYIIRNKRR